MLHYATYPIKDLPGGILILFSYNSDIYMNINYHGILFALYLCNFYSQKINMVFKLNNLAGLTEESCLVIPHRSIPKPNYLA